MDKNGPHRLLKSIMKYIFASLCFGFARAFDAYTIAGTGLDYSIDGKALESSFERPLAVARDPHDNLYFVDSYKIRMMTSSGQVFTIAGNELGFKDGLGSEALFYSPNDIIYKDGELFVADVNRIRKLVRTGDQWTVSTFAGSGSYQYREGMLETGSFQRIMSLATDGKDIFAVDKKIARVNATHISTFCGSGVSGFADGPKDVAQFKFARKLVFSNGFFYLADYSNSRVRRIDQDGTVTTLSGTARAFISDGPFSEATFKGPTSLAVALDGSIYLSDYGSVRVLNFTTNSVTTLPINFLNGNKRVSAEALVVDSKGDVLFIDTLNFGVRKLLLSSAKAEKPVINLICSIPHPFCSQALPKFVGGEVTTIAGNDTIRISPAGIAIDQDIIYFVDGNQINKIENGQMSTILGNNTCGYVDGNSTLARFCYPSAIRFDQDGNLIVADKNNFRVRKITRTLGDWKTTTLTGNGKAAIVDGTLSSTAFYWLRDIVVLPNKEILALDGTVRKILQLAVLTQSTAGNFMGVAYDPLSKNVYATDYFNNRIVGFDQAFNMFVVAGTSEQGYRDGPVSEAMFDHPAGLAVRNGTIFVADAYNTAIRTISPHGVVSTMVGGPNSWGFQDGPASNAKMGFPSLLEFDSEGNLLFSDQANHRLRKLTLLRV
jgi:DNA-binding beta-propeller fold protein YncE